MVYLQDVTTYEQSVSKMIVENVTTATKGTGGDGTYKEGIGSTTIHENTVQYNFHN